MDYNDLKVWAKGMNADALLDKIDRNHQAVMAALTALTATVSEQAKEQAAHSSRCDTDRVGIHSKIDRNCDEIQHLEREVKDNGDKISKITLKVVAIASALAAGGAGAVEVVLRLFR